MFVRYTLALSGLLLLMVLVVPRSVGAASGTTITMDLTIASPSAQTGFTVSDITAKAHQTLTIVVSDDQQVWSYEVIANSEGKLLSPSSLNEVLALNLDSLLVVTIF